jgi:hypothetical protein
MQPMIEPVAVFLVLDWSMKSEPIFVIIYIAQESLPRNRFRQSIYPGGIDSANLCILADCRIGPPGWELIPRLLKRFIVTGLAIYRRVVVSARQANSACNLVGSYGVIVWLWVSIIFVKFFILPGGNTFNLFTSEKDPVLASFLSCTLIKKKIKFSSKIRKFRVEPLQSHIRDRAS